MQTCNVQLYSYNYKEAKTYLAALLFVGGNVVLPQLFHQFHMGGPTWLPIYFFTLIGAFKYGKNVGVLTALLSPIINSMLFGMPNTAMLPIILIKSTLLALAASYAANKFKKINLLILAGVILFYQTSGALAEWALTQNLQIALQNIYIAVPGMLLQLLGGYIFIQYIIRK